jgi:uncharacterized protein
VTTVRAFVARHPVATYFALTFAISWGGFLWAVGPPGFGNTDWQTDARFPFIVLAMLSGPTVAGLLLTGLLDGRTGLREILCRLHYWRARFLSRSRLVPRCLPRTARVPFSCPVSRQDFQSCSRS